MTSTLTQALAYQGFHHAWCSDSDDGGLRKGLSQADRGELNYAARG